MNRMLTLSSLILFYLPISHARGLGDPGFESFASGHEGGGWMVHHHPRGDTLWGCADIRSLASCTQVRFDEWRPTAGIDLLHVTRNSQDAWMVLSSGGTDTLFACKHPTTSPECTRVTLGSAPTTPVHLQRIWPAPVCTEACDSQTPQSAPGPRAVIADARYADMWLSLSVTGAGSSNVYACRNLEGLPECVPGVADWLFFDREAVGLTLEELATRNDDKTVTYGPGVRVKKVAEGSVAFEAGLREGDTIMAIGGFNVDRVAKANAMFAQFPAGQPITVVKGDKSTIQLIPRTRTKP